MLAPRYSTPPLSENYTSLGPKVRAVFEAVWIDPQTGKLIKLDPWQADLIDRLLETYPPEHPKAGQLRWRQVVVLVPKQNGKSLIAACLTFFFVFFHVPVPNVAGTAGRNQTQAGIVYGRLRESILADKRLSSQFRRLPGQQHMVLKNGGSYTIYPASSDALQGQPITAGVLDELHLAKQDVWTALTKQQIAQVNSMLVGISTAGDENSLLLLKLTEEGRKLSTTPDPNSRFGYFEWSAPEDIQWDSPEAVLSCNPAVECGRIDIQRILDGQMIDLPNDYKRYNLNWTVQAKTSWVDFQDWVACARKWPELPNDIKPTVAATEITPGGTYATITLAAVDDSGAIHTRLDCSIPNPANSHLALILKSLVEEYPGLTPCLDSLRGKDLAERLREVGISPRMVSLGDVADASAWVADAIRKRKIQHDGESIYFQQMKSAKVKLLPRGGHRLVPGQGMQIDALQSLIMASYIAHLVNDEGPKNIGLYVF